ncbi:DUF4419 domain-containing protein [Polyangium aurulentum]|uniref:DUF4419 domain-containing protein n=1 Tax=Polyangium aurulentum TaxID=2567896 RepID=UPI001F483BC5|nr:DUF4419 domain-containing protein [Polyangium aurulentum]
MRTFAVSDVPAPEGPLHGASLAKSLSMRHRVSAEASACNLGNLVGFSGNPFVEAVGTAFSLHYPLVLSPDDVWLCIAQGFGAHVDVNAEALRSRFVRHEGKAEIRVRRDNFVKGSAENDWPGCFKEFSDGIAEHVGKMRDLVVADFSTTGPVERAASEIVLMSAFQRYFDYVVETRCGIPAITLLGTVEDWRSIRRRAEYLAEFGLGTWVDALLPVLDQIVAVAAGGALDLRFWRSFYNIDNMSGGPYVSGWINVLFPYLDVADIYGKARKRGPNPFASNWAEGFEREYHGGPRESDFPLGLSRVPFLWEYLGQDIPMAFLGGFVGVSQDPETLAVRPAIGWAVQEAAAEGQQG